MCVYRGYLYTEFVCVCTDTCVYKTIKCKFLACIFLYCIYMFMCMDVQCVSNTARCTCKSPQQEKESSEVGPPPRDDDRRAVALTSYSKVM